MLFKRLLYGNDFRYLYGLDCALSFFENSDFLPHSALFKGNFPPDFNNTIDQLTKDGMLEYSGSGYRITLAGKRRSAVGGYLRDALWLRLKKFTLIITLVVSLGAFLIKGLLYILF